MRCELPLTECPGLRRRPHLPARVSRGRGLLAAAEAEDGPRPDPDHQEPQAVQQQVQDSLVFRLPTDSDLPAVSSDLIQTIRADWDMCVRFLRGLEEMHVPKLVKEELGGGKKEFSLAEGGSFVNIEEADQFLTSGERQSVLLHFLNTLRADSGDVVGDIKFREGEAVSE